jgi:hypothetical protein
LDASVWLTLAAWTPSPIIHLYFSHNLIAAPVNMSQPRSLGDNLDQYSDETPYSVLPWDVWKRTTRETLAPVI